MAVVNDATVVVWGGYNGELVVQDEASVWIGRFDGDSARTVTSSSEQASTERKRLQDRWEAEVSLRESDLPDDVLEKAKRSSLPGALFKALRRQAVSISRDTYDIHRSGNWILCLHASLPQASAMFW